MDDVWKSVFLGLNIAGYVFAFLLIPRIILERRHPSATLAWMLGIALLPIIGVPLYFLIGVRRIRRNIRAKIAAVAKGTDEPVLRARTLAAAAHLQARLAARPPAAARY